MLGRAFVDHGVDVLFRPMHGSCWSISYAQLLSNVSRETITSCCMPSLVFAMSARGSTRQLFWSSLHLASAVPRQCQSWYVPRQGQSWYVAVRFSSKCDHAIPNVSSECLTLFGLCLFSQNANFLRPLHFHTFPQALINKCLYLIGVVLLTRYVSALFSKTDLTFVLNACVFAGLLITTDFHTCIILWKGALVLLIFVFTSASVPPRVYTVLLRQRNASTCSSASPSSVIRFSQVAFCLRIFVFVLLIFNPTCSQLPNGRLYCIVLNLLMAVRQYYKSRWSGWI